MRFPSLGQTCRPRTTSILTDGYLRRGWACDSTASSDGNSATLGGTVVLVLRGLARGRTSIMDG